MNSIFLVNLKIEDGIYHKDSFIKSNKEESKKIIKDFLQKHINNIVEKQREKVGTLIISTIFVGE